MISTINNSISNSVDKPVENKQDLLFNLPDDIKNIIFNSCDISNIIKIFRLNKKWYKYINYDKVIKNRIKAIFTDRITFCFPPGLHNKTLMIELAERIENLEIENLHEFEQIFKMYNLLKFWNGLAEISAHYIYGERCGKKPETFEHCDTISELFEIKDKFYQWLNKRKTKFSLMERLDLTNAQLETLPAEIGLFKYLKTLKLSYNKLTCLPIEIKQLENLATLELDYNSLSSWPSNIELLTNLRMLNLRGNQLTTVPPTISRLSNLIRIVFDKNPLNSLPGILKSRNVEIFLEEEKKHLLSDPNFWDGEDSIFKDCTIQ